MVIGDARTQTFATSQPAPDAPRPKLIGFLNGPIEWGNMMWAALTWDTVAPQPPLIRTGMLFHESFHIVQMELGLGVPTDSAEHLDSADGRYWMRLEWRALARALREAGEVRLSAIRDALAFRHARHARFANMAETERALDINEGLASYTQAVLPAPSEAAAIATVVEGLAAADGTVESFVRTFAYVSGPAYGLLLDTASPGWTRRVRASDDPAALLMRAIAGPLAADAAAAAARYGGPEVRAAEERREQAPVRRDETTIAGDGWTVKAEPESWIKSGSTRLLLDGPGTEVCVTGELQDQVRPPRLVAGKRDAPS